MVVLGVWGCWVVYEVTTCRGKCLGDPSRRQGGGAGRKPNCRLSIGSNKKKMSLLNEGLLGMKRESLGGVGVRKNA